MSNSTVRQPKSTIFSGWPIAQAEAIALREAAVRELLVLSLEALLSESRTLIEQGVPVFERLRISPHCPLILPSHVLLDRARERARGPNAIGTTGRGIGPAYEDKVGRRAIRVADLADRAALDAKLDRLLTHHNALRRGLNLPEADGPALIEALLEQGGRFL